MRKDDIIRIHHMLDAGRQAVSFAANKSRADLDNDPVLAFALMKTIEIIGEAASKVSRGSQERLKEIPWPEIVGMRNRLIHAYADISLDILWHTVTSNLPPLIQALERIIGSESEE
ncbi:MAG: DUF86 domain-containing protein [Desulfomonilaceae bacterium]